MNLTDRQNEMKERVRSTGDRFSGRPKGARNHGIKLPVYKAERDGPRHYPVTKRRIAKSLAARQKIQAMMELSARIPVKIGPISIQQSTMRMFERQ